MNKEYLGDAVYAELDGEYIILRTQSHDDRDATNIIYLDNEVLDRLINFYQECKETENE